MEELGEELGYAVALKGEGHDGADGGVYGGVLCGGLVKRVEVEVNVRYEPLIGGARGTFARLGVLG